MDLARLLHGTQDSNRPENNKARTHASVGSGILIALAESKRISGPHDVGEGCVIFAMTYARDPEFAAHVNAIADKVMELFPEPMGTDD